MSRPQCGGTLISPITVVWPLAVSVTEACHQVPVSWWSASAGPAKAVIRVLTTATVRSAPLRPAVRARAPRVERQLRPRRKTRAGGVRKRM